MPARKRSIRSCCAATLDDEPPPSVSGLTFVQVPELSAEVHIAAAHVVWKPGHFDALVRAVAAEEAGPFLFANFDRGTAYAPYDGGADLFLASPDDARDSA